MKKLLAVVSIAAGLALSGSPAQAAAKSFPDRPLRLVVAYAPGGASDLLARALGQAITKETNQSVIVENRPGGSTTIGAEAVLSKPADGYTALVVAASFVINPHLLKLPYNAEKDFQPVTLLASNPHVLVVNPKVPANNLSEFLAWAKAQKGKATFSSFGNGSSGHIGFELLEQMTGINMLHIPYKGAAPATLAVLTGEVDATLGDIGVVEPHIQTGKLKAIAVTGEHRAPTLPKVATFAESGLPGYSSQTWIGLWVRAGLPDDRLQRLNQLFNQALQRPEIKALLAKQGMQARPSTVAEFTAFARKESDKYKTAIDKAHIHIN